MLHIFIHTLEDLIKIIPFLFIAFLVMEYLEHGVKKKANILKNNKFSVLIGSILGVIPQCGFSVMATNLFSSKVITMGTLIAIYLSTSDEMLPLLISNNVPFQTIGLILLTKVLVGIIIGYLIDLFYKKKKNNEYSICDDDNCHCENGIFKSSLIHTLKIGLFIFITTLILNILIHELGLEKISAFLLKDNFFGPFISCLIGLIPNCASSILITEMYLSGVISTGMLIGGLLTGSGIGILVLFKVNKNIKENLVILSIIYLTGVIVGIFFDLFNIVF